MSKTILKSIFEALYVAQAVKNQFDFGNKMGYTSGYITEAMKKDRIPQKMQDQLHYIFGISYDFMRTNGKEGSMFQAGSEDDTLSIEEQPTMSDMRKEIKLIGKHRPLRLTSDQYSQAFGDWKGLPMYNVPITASFIEAYRDESVYRPQYYLHDPRFKDCDFGVIITGDSMYPEIRHGDFVVCKEITDRSFIVYGDIYYITAKNGLETCKYVNADPKNEDSLLLVPRNDSISPSPIPRTMIDKLHKVKGIVRGY